MKRIHKEIKMFSQEKPEHVSHMHVNERDTTTVHFLMHGPPGTPYEGGEYVVQLKLPPTYPLLPPKIRMRTPSGRFKVETDICATFTSFHPESWSPIYNFTAILNSFVSFMTDRDDASAFIGQEHASEAERRALAAASKQYNASKGYTKMFVK